jgi:hypothetical protein
MAATPSDALIDVIPKIVRGRSITINRSRRPAKQIVTAISLTAALAAQDNAFWLGGEVLVGEAVASRARRITAPD